MTPYRTALVALAIGLAPCVPYAQQTDDAVVRESRDAAAAFMSTLNFTVGRLGLECLAQIGRTETPKDFVMAWRQRNAQYYDAMMQYMARRLDAARATGGEQVRETVLREYAASVRQNGEASVAEWFRGGDRNASCRRAIAAIDSGAMDITAKAQIYGELQGLVEWAAGK